MSHDFNELCVANLLLYARPPTVVDTDKFSSHSQNHVLSIGQDCRYIGHSVEFSLIHPTNKEQLSVFLINAYKLHDNNIVHYKLQKVIEKDPRERKRERESI